MSRHLGAPSEVRDRGHTWGQRLPEGITESAQFCILNQLNRGEAPATVCAPGPAPGATET